MRCWRCKKSKPKGDFWKDCTRSDGIHGSCKECAKSYWKQEYRKKLKYQKNYKQHKCKSSKAWRQKNSQKVKAYSITKNAISNGLIKKSSACVRCGGKGKLHGHHADHNKPLKIKWLCINCHERLHHVKI